MSCLWRPILAGLLSIGALFVTGALTPSLSAEITDDLKLVREADGGQLFNTGDDQIEVLQLKGSWREMGKQYVAFAKDGMQQVWNVTVQPALDKAEIAEGEALRLFGKRVFATSSHRLQELYSGMAEAIGWPIEKVVLLSQSGMLGVYQAKIHSFAGCTSMLAWGETTTDGGMITARNMDWGEAFLQFPLYLTVFNPNDGSHALANLGWPGWMWAMTAINDQGVYVDLHDGTSMGGSVVYIDRPSFLGQMFDVLAESASAEAVSQRMNAMRSDVSWIFTVADASPNGFSYEVPPYDSRRRNPDGDSLVVVNTFLNPDWGIYKRDTVSNSKRRFENITARLAESKGSIDAEKAMDIFDLTLFNPDGSFKENGGATKPKKQDADLTDHQIVTDLADLHIWVKIPLKTEWRHIDLRKLFAKGAQQ